MRYLYADWPIADMHKCLLCGVRQPPSPTYPYRYSINYCQSHLRRHELEGHKWSDALTCLVDFWVMYVTEFIYRVKNMSLRVNSPFVRCQELWRVKLWGTTDPNGQYGIYNESRHNYQERWTTLDVETTESQKGLCHKGSHSQWFLNKWGKQTNKTRSCQQVKMNKVILEQWWEQEFKELWAVWAEQTLFLREFWINSNYASDDSEWY